MRARLTAAVVGVALAGGPLLAVAAGGWALGARVAATLALLALLAATAGKGR